MDTEACDDAESPEERWANAKLHLLAHGLPQTFIDHLDHAREQRIAELGKDILGDISTQLLPEEDEQFYASEALIWAETALKNGWIGILETLRLTDAIKKLEKTYGT